MLHSRHSRKQMKKTWEEVSHWCNWRREVRGKDRQFGVCVSSLLTRNSEDVDHGYWVSFKASDQGTMALRAMLGTWAGGKRNKSFIRCDKINQ